MTEKTDWSKVTFFKPREFQHPERMDAQFIYTLDTFRKILGRPLHITSSFRPGDTGTHGQGIAVDAFVGGMHWLDLFFAAERSGLFTGLGVYPYWNNPGIHMDRRKLVGRWARDERGNYVSLTAEFVRRGI